jgi:CRISPR-associated protein Cst2
MNPQSLSLSFRIPLAFHCLNNEGASGNVMEPRRITIQEAEYDGISGEMVRRHVLENFVRLCIERDIPLAPECRGLAPERTKQTLKTWMETNRLSELKPPNYNNATAFLIKSCALSDLGGYLIPMQKASDKLEGTLKRDSCFEFGWLITENPAIVEFTQQVAYRADPKENNPFTQNMRVGVYSGVFRFDLRRVGVSDWAWLNENSEARAINDTERNDRIAALLDALEQWLLSPSGARQAGWLQHQSDERDGIFCLSGSGPAPFVSPLALNLRSGREEDADAYNEEDRQNNKEARQRRQDPITYNSNYRQSLKDLVIERGKKRPGTLVCYEFDTLAQLTGAFDQIREQIGL